MHTGVICDEHEDQNNKEDEDEDELGVRKFKIYLDNTDNKGGKYSVKIKVYLQSHHPEVWVTYCHEVEEFCKAEEYTEGKKKKLSTYWATLKDCALKRFKEIYSRRSIDNEAPSPVNCFTDLQLLDRCLNGLAQLEFGNHWPNSACEQKL